MHRLDPRRLRVHRRRIAKLAERPHRVEERVSVRRKPALRRVPDQHVRRPLKRDERRHTLDLPLLRLRRELARHLRAVHVDRLSGSDPLLRKELGRRLLRRHLPHRTHLQDRILLRARRRDRLRRVLVHPAARELHLPLEDRVVELVALEKTLSRIGAEDEPVQPLDIRVAIDLQSRGVALDLRLEPVLRRRQPIARIRVRLLPLRRLPAAHRVRIPIEHLEERQHLVRVVAALGHEAEAEVVGLRLVGARVFQEQELQPRAGRLAERGDGGRDGRADGEPDLRQLRLAHLVRRMVRDHVPALVAEHRRQLGLAVHVREQPAVDEDRPAREREGVDARVVDDLVRERKVGAGRNGHLLAEIGHVRLELRIVVDAHLLLDLFLRVLAHLDLLGAGHEIELELTGVGIADAGAEQDGEE